MILSGALKISKCFPEQRDRSVRFVLRANSRPIKVIPERVMRKGIPI
jgi:hypothetical protein